LAKVRPANCTPAAGNVTTAEVLPMLLAKVAVSLALSAPSTPGTPPGMDQLLNVDHAPPPEAAQMPWPL
jgi:hypothetical protein